MLMNDEGDVAACERCGINEADDNAAVEAYDLYLCDPCWRAKAQIDDACVECGLTGWPMCADCGYQED